ncbi:MAG: enoyl-CoA hydratase/isomerase family protein [Phycisphaerales bacterium]|nr:MAG: enoyl-CoA hydratase/isomerase family protein [Phycisphaerales bacterium]
MTDLALLSVSDGVATLTLNRPEARNALSIELLGALRARVGELAQRGDVRACVVAGAGPAFCAGMDLKAVLDVPGAPAKLLSEIAELTLELRALPCATIALVRGAAIGGGCGLACVCDFAITHPEAKLGYPEVDLGVCPAVVAPWLIKKIGPGAARRVLLEGGVMSGDRAHELGLVTRVVPQDELDSATHELAQRLAKAGPRALRATKMWLNELDGSTDRALVVRGAAISAEVISTEEARDALRKKFQRRS